MILVTGANGQIGVDLVKALSEVHGADRILATDLTHPNSGLPDSVAFEAFDVRRSDRLSELLDAYTIDAVYHLAGILSAKGEQNPGLCWDVNVGGLLNVLEAGLERNFQIFWPSSIAVFGPETPRDRAPQTSLTDPRTMYGITKTTGEQLCRYHAARHGLDVRSLRFPGVISYAAPPGGGTTDYAVDMFISAVREQHYDCFVSEETRLPMMYMPDAVKAVLDLMQAPAEAISIRTSYNLTAFSFSAAELARLIRERIPSFSCDFEPDYRQKIADSWPRSIDDSAARSDWDWQPAFDLKGMVDDMLDHVSEIGPHTEKPAES
jgi:nucleoside-diphosphate-sugar epimerase